MARIYRSHEPDALGAYLGRDLLQEFPESVIDEGTEEGETGEEAIDPEALREAVLAEAREEAARKVQEAYQEGYKRGLEAGQRDFAASVATAAQALESAASAMEMSRETFLSQAESELVLIARGITERVVMKECALDPGLVARLARRALEELLEEEDVRLLVNPADRLALQEQRVSLLEEFRGLKRLQIDADEGVEPGGCVADTKKFRADFQPRALLDHIFEDVFGMGLEDV
jgi:flagellar biosynthesis/type III secretory pathway protein FliH